MSIVKSRDVPSINMYCAKSDRTDHTPSSYCCMVGTPEKRILPYLSPVDIESNTTTHCTRSRDSPSFAWPPQSTLESSSFHSPTYDPRQPDPTMAVNPTSFRSETFFYISSLSTTSLPLHLPSCPGLGNSCTPGLVSLPLPISTGAYSIPWPFFHFDSSCTMFTFGS